MKADGVLATIGALFGAWGVAWLAMAAHGYPGLESAALMLLVHAGALIAAVAAVRGGIIHPAAGRLAGFGLALGVGLFAGAIGWRTVFEAAPFPMAAPIGGTLTIAAWLLLAVGGLLAMRRPAS